MEDLFLNLLKYPLDNYQETALKTTKNALIAAGAGSGKTQVLATRFAWLVMTGQAKASEILTLTFTNKAASEMYQRIYQSLYNFSNFPPSEKITQKQINLAKFALEDFSNVHIQTLDSYCSSIVRQCANRYGIKPDFSVGSSDCDRNVKDQAFVYVLQNMENVGIKTFSEPGKIQEFAEHFFANIILKHTSLATEQNYFAKMFNIQLEKITQVWNEIIIGKENGSIYQYVQAIKDEYAAKGQNPNDKQKDFVKQIEEIISQCDEIIFSKKITTEDITLNSELLKSQISHINSFFDLVKSVPPKKGVIQDVGKKVTELKHRIEFFESIIAFIIDYEALKALNLLLDDFLEQVNTSKRVSGNLSFVDVSELALKVLLENEDIRNQEKNSYKKIMIDEFQDNNGKNRDLLYILSLKEGEFEENGKCIIKETSTLSLHDLLKDRRSPEKLFFVGDEKQSIYKFRGAEVSVFNELTQNNENLLIPMTYNYRSSPELVKAFNVIFKNGNGLFDSYSSPNEIIEYEAYYDKDAEKKDTILPELTSQNIPIHAFTLYTKELDQPNTNFLPEKDQLAFAMAKKIYDLGNEHKNWSDFAILDRSRTDRNTITKYLSLFGIPYTVDQQKNIFNDGVINDFYSFLRICVYPSDINAFASYLCSPFCGLSENAIEIILAYLNEEKYTNYDFVFNPFADFTNELQKELSSSDFIKYQNAIAFYKENKNLVLQQKLTTTLSKLWHEKGYKYETMLNTQVSLCEEHFDMLFELARQSEESGKNVSWFIDQLDSLKNTFSSDDADLNASDITYPIERPQAVNIMTIHKSKGLQFEHVFLYGCTNFTSKSENAKYFYDEEIGIAIKPEKNKNYFSLVQEEIAKQKELAEFRRVIYVGITRAVKDVYIMASYKVPDKGITSSTALFEKMFNLYYPYNPESKYTFVPEAGFDYLPITPVEYSHVYHNVSKSKSLDDIRKEKIENTKDVFINASELVYECKPIPRTTPSSLEKNYNPSTSQDSDTAAKYEKSEDFLQNANFTAADFGTLVHSYLEMQANGINPEDYNPEPKLLKNLNEKEITKLKEDCIKYTNQFAASTKGIEFEAAKSENRFYRAEWGFRMFHNGTIFTGSIDLIFQNQDGTYTIVDYKSDGQIDADKYKEQQYCYRTAASKLLKVPEEKISLFLYFLKFNQTIEL